MADVKAIGKWKAEKLSGEKLKRSLD